jgi:hypothetical protein
LSSADALEHLPLPLKRSKEFYRESRFACPWEAA